MMNGFSVENIFLTKFIRNVISACFPILVFYILQSIDYDPQVFSEWLKFCLATFLLSWSVLTRHFDFFSCSVSVYCIFSFLFLFSICVLYILISFSVQYLCIVHYTINKAFWFLFLCKICVLYVIQLWYNIKSF